MPLTDNGDANYSNWTLLEERSNVDYIVMRPKSSKMYMLLFLDQFRHTILMPQDLFFQI